MKTFIIAEAGVNHNGELEQALRLVDVAADAGADAVKFQTFKSEKLVTQNALKAEYQTKLTDKTESQIQMLKRLELPENFHYEIASHCDNRNIEFMSTAFDLDSLEFLLKKMPLKRLKIPSGEITNYPLIYQHALSGLDIILSTGMSTLGEVEAALKVIAAGYLFKSGVDVGYDWDAAFLNEQTAEILKNKVTILHCVSEYPAPANSLNLNVIKTISNTFGLKVGYSDHSLGVWAPISAVSLGASVIEKHFTLDTSLPGPDHKASLEPAELNTMVEGIRNVELGLGNGIKKPVPSELKNRTPIRKSLVVTKELKSGEVITAEHIAVMRPEGGLSPSRYWDLLNTPSNKDYEIGDFFQGF